MKILLTGATGYIGKRLLPVLVEQGHDVICCVRDIQRFNPSESLKRKIKIIQADLLNKASLENIPKEIDGAYYLVHSMSASTDYATLEQVSAINFRNALIKTQVKHVVYFLIGKVQSGSNDCIRKQITLVFHILHQLRIIFFQRVHMVSFINIF